MGESYCIRCGLKLFGGVANPGYEIQRDKNGQRVVNPKEPWIAACPGSRENLEQYPTYGDWIISKPYETNGGGSHRATTSALEALIAISS